MLPILVTIVYCDFIFHIPELFGNVTTNVNLSNHIDKLESSQYQAGLDGYVARYKPSQCIGGARLGILAFKAMVPLSDSQKPTCQYLGDLVPSPRCHLYCTSNTNNPFFLMPSNIRALLLESQT